MLTADINLNDHLWTPIFHHTGDAFSWVGFQTNYTGSIYGDYHTISNMRLGALAVNYTFPSDNSAYKAKKGDIWHNDEYGFVVTKGKAQELRFNGVSFSRATAGKGDTGTHGTNSIVYDTYNAILVYGDAGVRDVELDRKGSAVFVSEAKEGL